MRTRSLLLGLGLAALTSSAAYAADPPAAPTPAPAPKVPAWKQFCAPDIEKHCKEAEPTGGAAECLKAHEAELTEECQSGFLWKYKIAEICKHDIQTLCKDVLAAGGTLGRCFKENEAKLSKDCREALIKGSQRATKSGELKPDDKAAPGGGDKVDDGKPAARPAKPRKK